MDALRRVFGLMFALDGVIAAYGRLACVAAVALIAGVIALGIYKHRVGRG